MLIVSYLLAGLIVLVRVYVPISGTVIGEWPMRLAIFALWCLAVLGVRNNNLGQFFRELRSRWLEILCYVTWIAILAVYWTTQEGGHTLTAYMLNAYIGTIPFYFLGTYYSIEEGKGRYMALAIALVVGASCALAIPAVWSDPTLVREGAIVSTNDIRSQGIGGYGDITGFAVILPFLITASLQNKNIFRLAGLAGCVATMAFLMIATLSGIILLTGMAVAGCLIYYMMLGGFQWRRMVWAPVAVAGLILVAMYVFPSVYERVSIGKFYDKLVRTYESFSGIVSGETKDPTHRYTLMRDSLNVFLDNPILGASMGIKGETPGTGGHSSWMDALANYGLFGGIPFLMFHALIFYRLWKAWLGDRRNALQWGCLLSCALYLFYALFNVTTQGTTVALFLYVTAAGGKRPQVPVVIRREPVAIPRKEKR